MSDSGEDQLRSLEQAIMARAGELAQEFTDKASRQRDSILRDTAERLHIAEEREVLVAKADAERHFRRVTQASELKMQARLDQLRWEMVQTVQARLAERIRSLTSDRDSYRQWLATMIADAVERLPAGEPGRVMRDDLVAIEVEINPVRRRTTQPAAEHIAVESGRGLQVIHREGQMERWCHACSSLLRTA